MLRAIDAVEVLPIAKEYFRLRRPPDRRVNEIARKHCGAQATRRIMIDKLQRRVGSKQARKQFAAHLRGMVQTNHLPDHTDAGRRAPRVLAAQGGRAEQRRPRLWRK
ncbi:MAG: replication initiator protein A [Hyphomicrobiaceae bacterium]